MLKLTDNTLSDSRGFLAELGIEFSDDWSFFTLETQKSRYVSGADTNDIGLHTGKVRLEYHNKLQGNLLWRQQKITVLESVRILDFVTRYTFPKHLFTSANISTKKIRHEDNNIYHQYPTRETVLSGDHYRATIELTNWQGRGFMPYLYVRDEPGTWVVHVRLLPTTEGHPIVVKYNTSWYDRSLPTWLQKAIPKALKRQLLYLGERKHRWSFFEKMLYILFPFSSYHLVNLQPGEEILVDSTLRVDEL